MSIVELRKEPAWRCRQLTTKHVGLSDSKTFKVVIKETSLFGTGYDVHYMACESQDRAFPQTGPLETHGRRETKTKRTRGPHFDKSASV